MRLAPLACCFVLAAGCGQTLGGPPPTGASDFPRPLQPEPESTTLHTGPPHLVRVSLPSESAGNATLVVSSPTAGVTVIVDDDGERRDLPLALDLEPGEHRVRASCPTGSRETYQVSLIEEGVANLQVCAPVSPRP